MISPWATCFQVDPAQIIRQIPIAHEWCERNPKKAFKKDAVRYLFNWLKIADRKGSLQHRPTPVYREVVPEADMTIEEMREIRRRNMPQRGTLAEKHKGAIDV